ncbi:Xylosidase arabinosidase, partial [Rhizoctonia solani]
MTSKQPSDPGKKLTRADPTTIRGKFLVGYQGWFTCPNDGPSVAQANEWAHWTDKDGQFNAELLPDPEYYSSGDLAVMPRAQHRLFSSRNPAIIRRHLNIMAMHGIDGLFLTRRGSEIAAAYQPGRVGIKIMKLRSEGINNIFRAAEQEARVVSIMYDLNGLPSHQIEQWIMGDWDFMVNSKNVLNSPAYVREHGQPVVALWSVGFKHAGQEPEMIMRLINRIRELAGGAYIILGVPITWQKQDQNWQAVYSVADAIAPMCIGTFQDESGAERFSKDFQQPGIQASKSGQKKTDYVGVVWPGNEGPLIINTGSSTEPAPRQDGAFFWRQIYNGYKDGVRFMYAEMFDGFEEGTAILPSLGAQSDSTPSDWYLRIAGSASEALKGEKRLYEEFPRKELFEYWSTRPRYEERDDDQIPAASGSANPLGGFGPSAHVAQASAPAPPRAMTVDMSDAPPPYSIEDDSLPAPAPSSFTTEPESLTSGPANPASPITSYHNAPFPPADRPPVSRVDSTHSVGSHGSYPGQQQHRPEPIAVPGNAPVAIAVQTPTTYTAYTTQPQVGFPSGPTPPMAGIGGQTSPSVMPIRPPQHPSVASRPPATAPRPPSRPGRPPSSGNTHPSPPPNTFPVAGIGGLTDQLGGMNIGEPDRPAPEHVFAGANQPRPQMTQPPGTPNSPFEGINYPGRFGGPDARRDSYGQTSGSGPSTPSVGMPGSPLYPAPLQGGGPHTSPGPIHQLSPGPVHQATLFGSPHNTSPPSGPHPHPQHQSTLGPGQYAPPSPHHRPTLGPTPTHQSTLGPGTSQSPRPSFQPHQQYAPAGPSPNPPGQYGHLPASGSGQYPPQGQGSGGQYNQGPGGQYPPQGPSGQHPYGPGGQQPPQSSGSSTHSGHSGYYGSSSPSQSGGHSTPQSGWPPQAPGSYSPYPPQGPGGPGQQQVYGQGQGQGYAAPGPQHPQWNSMAGGQYVDTAIGIIGKYAGQDTKKKVEQGLEGAFKVGTKVWGRLHNNKASSQEPADKRLPPLSFFLSSVSVSTMHKTPTHFMSYLFQSFVPGKLSRLCILGVDVVGIPVVLVVGVPQVRTSFVRKSEMTEEMTLWEKSKALAVAGWFGLRIALSGLCYLEYRWDMARARVSFENNEEKEVTCQLPIMGSELPATNSNLELATPVVDSEPPKIMVHEEQAPSTESDRVEFPRMDADSIEGDHENGGRVIRKISMSSVDSDGTVWSECQTPAQTSVELPVELSEEPIESETSRPGEDEWFGTVQEQVVKPKPEPGSKSPLLRRKRSKYGACPLILRKSSASLYVSPVTAKTEAT